MYAYMHMSIHAFMRYLVQDGSLDLIPLFLPDALHEVVVHWRFHKLRNNLIRINEPA
jgi:hypothetical protein